MPTPRLKPIAWNGQPVTRPGIYADIPLAMYHTQLCTGPSVSSSGLRILFMQSPAHFFSSWSGNPHAIDREDKRHFILGRALHHLMLGEKHFSKLFAAQPRIYPDAKTG